MKTGRFLRTVSVLLVFTFMCQTVVSANPDILRGDPYVRECLAPHLRSQARPVPVKMQMMLVRIAETALERRVRPERMRDFMRSDPSLTPALAERMVFDRCGIDLSTGRVTLACRTGEDDKGAIEVYRIYRKDPLLDAGAGNDPSRVVLGDMVFEIVTPSDSEEAPGDRPGASAQDDITGASEGGHAVHEAYKEFILRPAWLSWFLWIPVVGKMIRRRFGEYVIRGQKGVNDVIREFWTSGDSGEVFSESDDMEIILDELRRTPAGEKIARSILDNGYRVWIYDTGSRYLIDGITTHYGIRSGSIHIATKEYFRLKALGWEHLAARIAHEVIEIDAWRNRANTFMNEGRIDSLGAVPGVYDEGWAQGIRKWIRDNHSGPAQQLDKKYHKKGVESEVSVLINGKLNTYLSGEESGEAALLSLRDLAREFLDGRYTVLVDDPYEPLEDVDTPDGDEAYQAIRDTLFHFNKRPFRLFFMQSLYARLATRHIMEKDGGLAELMKGENNFHDKAAGLLDRTSAIKEVLRKVDRIDPVTRENIMKWLDDAVERTGEFPVRMHTEIIHNTVDLRELLSDKTKKPWDHGHSSDPDDILGSASQDDSYLGGLNDTLPPEETVIYGKDGPPDTSSSTGDSTTWRRSARLGDMSSSVIADSIRPVGEPSLRTLDSGSIIKMLEEAGNWAYTARQRAVSLSGSAKSRASRENRTMLKNRAVSVREEDPAEAAELFLAAGEPVSAAEVVQEMKVREHSVFELERKDRLIRDIVRFNIDSQEPAHLKDAFTLAQEMRDEDERDTALGDIVRALLASDMLHQAREVADHIESKLKSIKALADTAKAQYGAGYFDDAEETASLIPEDSPTRSRVLDEIKRARRNADLRSPEAASDIENAREVRSSTALSDPGTGTRFGYIEPFADEELFKQRIDHARRSARSLLVGTKPGMAQSLLGWTGNNRNFRMYYGSSTGYFESKSRASGLKHEIDITIVVDGMVAFTGEPAKYRKDDENLPEDIKEAIDEIRDADIECLNLYVTGTDNFKAAFRNDEELSPSTCAALQRLFMRVTRRDIPVTGVTSIVPPIPAAMEPFEKACVSEMVAELEAVQAQLLSLNEEKARLPVMQLTEGEKAIMYEDKDRIKELASRAKPKTARFQELKKTLRELEREKADIVREQGEWKSFMERKKCGENITEEEKDRAARTGASSQMKYYDWLERRDSIQVEYNEIYRELSEIQLELKEKRGEYESLSARHREYEETRQDIEGRSAVLHRQKELLIKRIEEAQYNIPIVEGSIISGRYKILSKLGEGGAGVVFRVLDMQRKDEKALKFLSKGKVDEKSLRRFKREQDVMEKMNPVETGAPIPVLEERNGHYAGREYFAMTMVPGIPLSTLISKLRKGDLRLTAREKETLAYALSLTLAKFHGGLAIHRDLKPGNIIIPADENGYPVIPEVADVNKAKRPNSRFMTDLVSRIRIIDLGVSLMGEQWEQDETGSHAVQEDLTLITGEYGKQLVGTPMYMAPEQAKGGEEAIPHSLWDCYSMGVILYELFSHEPPYGKKKGLYELLNQIVDRGSDPVPLIDSIRENNASNRVTTEAHLDVNEARLDRIRRGLVEELALEEDPSKKVIEVVQTKDGPKYRWIMEAMGHKEFRSRLSRYENLSPSEVEKVAAMTVKTIPQVDGYMEALIMRAISYDKEDRLTASVLAEEFEKHLNTDMNEMICGTTRGGESLWNWLKKSRKAIVRFTFFMLVVGGLVSGGSWWLSHKMIKEADRKVRHAEERIEQAENRMEQADERYEEMARKMEEMSREKEKLTQYMEGLNAEKLRIEREKQELKAKVKGLREQAARAIELDKKSRELEAKAEELGANVAALLKREAELKKQEEDLKERIKMSEEAYEKNAQALKKARDLIEKYRGSMAGILSDVKTRIEAHEIDEALDLVDRIRWWTINDLSTLKQYNTGMTGLVDMLLDRGYLEKAVELQIERADVLKQVMKWGAQEEMKLQIFEDRLKNDILTVRILRMGWRLSDAMDLIRATLERENIKASRKATELLHAEAVRILLASAYRESDAEVRDQKIEKAGALAERIESRDIQYRQYALIYLLQNEYRSSRKYFYSVRDMWQEKASEEGIAAPVKTARTRKAGIAMALGAAAYIEKALRAGADGDRDDEVKSSSQKALELLAEMPSEYRDNEEVAALTDFIKAEGLSLAGESGEADKLYESLAAGTGQSGISSLVRLLAKKRKGRREDSAGQTISDTWSALIQAVPDIPFFMVEDLRKEISAMTSELHFRIRKQKIEKSEEEKRLRAQKREEELRKIREEEEARKKKEEAEFVKNVLAGIEKPEDVRARLDVVRTTIRDLTAGLGNARTRAERARMEEQIEKEKKRKAILKDALEQMGGSEETEEKKTGEDNTTGMTGGFENPIANSMIAIPDHRLVNAILAVAISYNSVKTRSSDGYGGVKVISLGESDTRNFGDIFALFNEAERSRVRAGFSAACQAAGLSGDVSEALFRDGLSRLVNMKGHAGVRRSTIFVPAGVAEEKNLILHEAEELRLHQAQAATYVDAQGWENVPQNRQSRALREMRSDPRYNDMAGTFHRMAQNKYPVQSHLELVEDGTGTPDVNDPYRRPIAASSGMEPPEWDMAAFTGIIGALATGISHLMGAYIGETAVPHVEERGLVVFADDVVDCSAVFDLEQVAEMIGQEGKPVNKVVLYARTPEKAAVVEKVIRTRNPGADIRVVLRQELADHCGDEFFSMSETEALLRYTMNRKSGNIFRRPEDILGIVRGPLREGEDADDMKDRIRSSSLRVPVVMFRDSAPGNVYSLREAILRLMRIRNEDDIRGMVYILPPITRISRALQERYHQYINMVRALEAAA